MPVGVIIVAGGRGARLGAAQPKQLLELGGRTVLRRSIEPFDAHPDVDQIVVVLPADLLPRASEIVGDTRLPCRATAGGERRQDSVRLGLAVMPPDVEHVLVHDAARPFVDGPLIDRVIQAVRAGQTVVPAVQARDTVKRVPRGSDVIAATIARDEIWLAQTPQGFPRAVLAEALALGDEGIDATDEAMLAERLGREVIVVPGDARNFKITTVEDLMAARQSLAEAPRVGTGYDLHRLVAERRLVLAGIEIPFDKGPLGHSDGDVVCHALTDAILGAAGAGDIGQHFPNTDPRWKDAAGLDLLTRAVAVVGDRGWKVASADVTVILERPRLVPHLALIRARLAEVLGVDQGAVSVKGKTNEGVDAVGRGEAIAAHAVGVLVPGGST